MESRSSTKQITQGLGEDNVNYKELWNLSQKLAFNVPQEGEYCLYFPQGHLEQVDLSNNHEFDNSIAHMNLPSRIFCRVLNIGLSVEEGKKDIQFHFTMIPETIAYPRNPYLNPNADGQRKFVNYLFKSLMTSDTNKFEVLAMNDDKNMPLRVLTTVSHVVTSRTMFSVHYKQSASPFVIRLNKYLETVNNNIHVGMRFKMKFLTEDSIEISFFGTIASIEDFSPHWPNSNWRCLKVQWDVPATFSRPDKVSPWEIQPVTSSEVGIVFEPIIVMNKKFNLPVETISRTFFSSPTSLLTPPLWNESTSSLSKLGHDKANLKDSSSFLFEPEKDKACTSTLASVCNWVCCCFK